MSTLIDRFATKRLESFKRAVRTPDTREEATVEIAEIVDFPLLHVCTLKIEAKDAIRGGAFLNNHLFFGGYDQAVRMISLAGDGGEQLWTKNLTGRVLACEFAVVDNSDVAVACTENGHLEVFAFDGGRIAAKPGNEQFIALATAPTRDCFAVCSYTQKSVSLYQSDLENESRCSTLYHPRKCFWLGDDAEASLCVVSYEGWLEFFDVADGQLRRGRAPIQLEMRRRDAGIFDASFLLNTEHGFTVVCSASPEETCQCFDVNLTTGKAALLWVHNDHERCFALTTVRHRENEDDTVVFCGGAEGSVSCYTAKGQLLFREHLNQLVRCVVPMHSADGQAGLAVAYGTGNLALYWCPPSRLLGDEFHEQMNQQQQDLFFTRARGLPFLAGVAAKGPQSLDEVHCEDERYAGMLGLFDSWIQSGNAQNVLPQTIEKFFSQNTCPEGLQLVLEGLLDDLFLACDRRDRGYVFRLVQQLSADSFGLAVNQFQKAVAFAEDGLFQEAVDNLPALMSPRDEFVWSPVAFHTFHSPVAEIVSGMNDATIVSDQLVGVLNDGSLHRVSLETDSKGQATRRSGFEFHCRMERFESTQTFTRPQSVAVIGPNVFGACDNGKMCVYRYDVPAEPARLIDLDRIPLCAVECEGNVLVGTADGLLQEIHHFDGKTESTVTGHSIVTEVGGTAPIWSVTHGVFRPDRGREIAVFKRGDGVSIGQLDNTLESVVSPEPARARSRFIACDWDGDGYDEIFFLSDDSEGELSVIDWNEERGSFVIEKIPLERGAHSLCTFRDISNGRDAGILCGCSSGLVTQIFPNREQKLLAKLPSIGDVTSINSFESQGESYLAVGANKRLVVLHAVPTKDIMQARRHWSAQLKEDRKKPLSGNNPFETPEVLRTVLRESIDELTAILSSARRLPVVLHGLPGSGKTEVLRAASEAWVNGASVLRRTASVKFGDDAGLNVNSFGRAFSSALAAQLGIGVQSGSRNRAMNDGGPIYVTNYLNELRSYLRKEGAGVLVLFDGGDGRVGSEGSDGGHLFEQLNMTPLTRAEVLTTIQTWAKQLSPEIQFVFVAEPKGIAQLRNEEFSFTTICCDTCISKDRVETDLLDACAGGMEFFEHANQEIIQFSGGLPDLTREIYARLWDYCRKNATVFVTKEAAKRNCTDFLQADERHRFERIWEQFEPDARVALALAARLQRNADTFYIKWTAYDQVSVLADKFFSAEQYRECLDRFCDVGIMEKYRTDFYQFTIDGLTQWINHFHGNIQATIFQLLGFGKDTLDHERFVQLDKELRGQNQLDDVLEVVKLTHRAWDKMVEFCRSFSGLCNATDLASDEPIQFLHAFVNHTNSLPMSDIRSIDDGGAAWTVVQFSDHLLQDDRPTVVVALSKGLLQEGRRRDVASTIAKAFGDFQSSTELRPGQVSGPKNTLVLCGTADEAMAKACIKNVAGFAHASGLTLSDIEAIAFAIEPPIALRERLQQSQIGRLTVNPYQWEGHVTRSMVLVPRQLLGANDGHDLVQELSQPERQYSICGTRRIGKTTLLLGVQKNIHDSSNDLAVYCSFEPLVGFEKPADPDFLSGIWQVLTDAIEDSSKGEWKPKIKDRESLRAFVQLLDSKKSKLVLLLDEVDVIAANPVSRGFFADLRQLAASTQYRLRSIICGWKQVYSAKKNKEHPLYNFAQPIILGTLSLDEARKLVRAPLKLMSISLENDPLVCDRIIKRASRHPSFLQCFMYHLVRRCAADGNQISTADFESVASGPEVRAIVDSTVLENFEGLALLMLGILGEKSSRVISASELKSEVGHHVGDKTVDEQEFSNALDLLTVATVVSQTGRSVQYTFPQVLESTDFQSYKDRARRMLVESKDIHA